MGVAVGCTLVGRARDAAAGGLYVAAYGPAAQAQSGAYVATADDAMAIFTNPAGLGRRRGSSLQVGSSLIDYSLAFSRRGTYDDVPDQTLPWEGQAYATVTNQTRPALGVGRWQAVPSIAAFSSVPLGRGRLAVAAGFTAPPAYPGRNIEDDYVIDDPERAPPPNRYDVLTQEAAFVLPSLALAYEIDQRWSVGLRASWGQSSISSSVYAWTLPTPNYEEWVGNEAKIAVDATDDFVPQVAVGAHVRVSESVELGAMWQSRAVVKARGSATVVVSKDLKIFGFTPEVLPVADADARCAPGGTPDAIKMCMEFALPAGVDVGGRWIARYGDGSERASVEANARWEQWSRASDFVVTVDAQAVGVALEDVYVRHGFQDVWSLRLGGNYRLRAGWAAATLRGGVAYDSPAAKDGWERLDIDGAARLGISGGVGLALGRYVALELAVAYLRQGVREVGGTCNPTIANPGCNNGAQTAWQQRGGPDPINPLRPNVLQFESPYNAGRYESHYALASAAITARW